jgi:hypothetical protein
MKPIYQMLGILMVTTKPQGKDSIRILPLKRSRRRQWLNCRLMIKSALKLGI